MKFSIDISSNKWMQRAARLPGGIFGAALIAVLLASPPAQAVDPADLLLVDDAFSFSAQVESRDTILVRWEIADGYYMYRHRISFATDTSGVILGEPELPAGEHKVDEFFGEVQTYRDFIDVRVPILAVEPGVSLITLRANSQGCADLGVCYPPHTQTAVLDLPPAPQSSPPGLPGLSGASPNLIGEPLAPSPFDDPDQALPEDLAFVYEAAALGPEEILVRFTIAPGYYMYQDKFAFRLEQPGVASLGEPIFPEAVAHSDEHFGDVMVYYDQAEISLPLLRHDLAKQNIELTADFMGCKEAGICYPPMTRTVTLQLPEASADQWVDPASLATSAVSSATGDRSDATAAPVSESDRLASALARDGLWVTMLLFFGLGIALAFTPCVFPMIPILSSLIAGQGDSVTTRRAFTLSLVYVLAMALVYTAVGVIAGLSGYNLQAAFQNQWVLLSFAAVMVALAMAMFGFYELQLPSSWQTKLTQMSNSQEGGTLVGAAIMGMLSALIVGPCVAPPLMGALIYISQTGDGLLGGAALFAMALGMGAPLLLIGASAGKLLPRAGGWMDAVKAVFGVGLLALAIWLLERILPPNVVMMLWGVLAISSGVYLGALERLPEGRSGWRALWKSSGVILLLMGAIQLLGAFTGGRDWMDPLSGLTEARGSASGEASEAVLFEPVKSSEDLDRRLAQAAADNRPVMLDFYADWCVDCKRMDRYTFPEPEVQAALSEALVLKADVTANDELDQALLKRFGLIGPPAILFFDRNAQERRAWRVIGYMRAEDFASHASDALAAQ